MKYSHHVYTVNAPGNYKILIIYWGKSIKNIQKKIFICKIRIELSYDSVHSVHFTAPILIEKKDSFPAALRLVMLPHSLSQTSLQIVNEAINLMEVHKQGF